MPQHKHLVEPVGVFGGNRFMLLENIQWDCDGMKPVEDCNLPLNVLAVNVPGADVMGEDEVEEYLADLLSETYGFCHDGFTIRGVKLDNKGHRQAKPWPELAQAVLDADNGQQPRFIRFEYDLTYNGGDYSKTGDFALVPVPLCEALGDEEAFEKHTGHSRIHIVHYSPDELYNAEGDNVEE